MTRFAEARHEEWIAAPVATVRAQFIDLQHHIDARVHPSLQFTILSQGARRARFTQEVRLLGIRQRDVFEREIEPDGSIVDTSIEGFNKGGSIVVAFRSQARGSVSGTGVTIVVRLPLPTALAWLRPLLAWQVRREVIAAALQDKADIELRGYPRRAAMAQAAAA